MKRTLLLICTLLCANVLFAQEQLATLKHNDSISVYYGANAFVQAYNAATHGDIITLSDGIFSTPSRVQKGITVRGNGAVADTARRSSGTYFMESFNVDYSSIGEIEVNIEGVRFAEIYKEYCSYSNRRTKINLTKCIIDTITSTTANQSVYITAYNCLFKGGCGHGVNENLSCNIYNCILNEGSHYFPHYAKCYNSIIMGKGDNENTTGDAQFHNCILINTDSVDTVIDHYAYNNILINCTTDGNEYAVGNVAMSLSDVFENWDGASLSTDLETYVLKSSVSDSIQGIDGTEIGIFGGFMPFDWRPTYSVIKRFNVANRTTADGKLSVDIEVISE
jgi:hypothetical protein